MPSSYPFTSTPQTTDLGISKSYPAVQYGPQETSALYYEDREVGGTMYRVQNASWNATSQNWVAVDTTRPCFAEAITPAGVTEFMTVAAGVTPFTSWTLVWSIDANGNALGVAPGSVFDPRKYGALFDGVHDDAPGINAAILAAASTPGSTVVFPAAPTSRIGSPILCRAGVSIDGSRTGFVTPTAGYSGDAFVFIGGSTAPQNGARYNADRYELPSIDGITPPNPDGTPGPRGPFASGIHLQGNSGEVWISIRTIQNCSVAIFTDPFSVPHTGDDGLSHPYNYGVYDPTIWVNYIYQCTYGFKFAGNSTAPDSPAVLQGAYIFANFLNVVSYFIYFTETAQPGRYENYNVMNNTLVFKACDAGQSSPSQGITFDKAILFGGSNSFICDNYFGGDLDHGFIVASNGGGVGNALFKLAPTQFSRTPQWSDFAGATVVGPRYDPNKIIANMQFVTHPGIGMTASTTPGLTERAKFNAGGPAAGVPVWVNRYQLLLPVPALSAGGFADFYAWHPFAMGFPGDVKAWLYGHAFPLVLTTVDDESVFGGPTAAATPFEVHLRVYAFGAFPGGNIPAMLEAGT